MMGMSVWLRRHAVIPVTTVSLSLSLVISVLVQSMKSWQGEEIEIAPFWVSAAASLAVMFLFSPETPGEVIAPRSIRTTRCLLAALSLTIVAAVSALCFPGDLGGYAGLATARNMFALIGVGLLSRAVVPAHAQWVTPAVISVASLMFSWPTYPTTWQSIWGALRSSSSVLLPGGQVNLANYVCVAVGIAGYLTYIVGTRNNWTVGLSSSRPGRTGPFTVKRGSSPSRGIRRASFSVPLGVSLAALVTLMLLSDSMTWGGNSRLLLSTSFTNSLFLLVPLAAMAGVIIGQTRWRNGTSVWEKVSPRPTREISWRVVRLSAATSVSSTVVPVLVLVVVSSVVMARGGVPAAVVRDEAFAGTPKYLLAVAVIACASCAGALAGYLVPKVWVAPCVLVVCLAAYLPMGSLSDTDVDSTYAGKYPQTECVSSADSPVTVCSAPPNAPYLEMTHSVVDRIYEASRYSDALPSTVFVANSALEKDKFTTLAVGLSGVRSIFASEPADETSFRDDLVRTAMSSCPSVDREKIFAALSDDPLVELSTDDRESIASCLGD